MSSALPHPGWEEHPCFSSGARNRFGRIHLPVAPGCNIECAYCRREYDCAHENRPGVTSRVIGPGEALERLERALVDMPRISVAAVAGPGDPFCDPERTLETFERIRAKNAKIALCVSSNGLNVRDYVPRLRELGVGFVTITVNAVDSAVGARLHLRASLGGREYLGHDAAALLLSRQLEAVALLKEAGMVVKVNCVVVPGINEDHAVFVAARLGRMGVDLLNLLPLIPVAGTALEGCPPPGEATMRRLRHRAGRHVPQMSHCTRCRADAAGML